MQPLSFFIALVLTIFISNRLIPAPKAHSAPPEPAKLETGEWFPGGRATTHKAANHPDVFSQPSRGIGFEGRSKFLIGNAIFRKLWVSSPASTKSSDGLGPLYNARGCQNCHLKDGRGHPPKANWPDDNAISMILKLGMRPETKETQQRLAEHVKSFAPDPTYGGQLQDLSVQGHHGEGRIHITYEDVPVTFADGSVVTLRKPTYKIINLKYGPMQPETRLSPRIAPQMIGLGLLEAISEADIIANADPEDKNKDGISGRASKFRDPKTGEVMLGRFGWKASTPSVLVQSAAAFSGDMGLSTSLFPDASGDCTVTQTFCRNAPNGKTPDDTGHEVSNELLDFTVFYSQNLAVPKRRNADSKDVLIGKTLFAKIGCAACHTPSFTTGHVPGQKHLSGQKIWPFTDLLLHDMGDGLADNFFEGSASGREWRTPPLWGIGLTGVVSRHTFFLHDGRARNIEEAILWHGGESEAAQKAYRDLTKPERDALIRFVKSL